MNLKFKVLFVNYLVYFRPEPCVKLIKLDSQGRLNVDFKPAKRMKKRRELDALVSNVKQSSGVSGSTRNRARSKNGKHELLRNDSDSSEVEEFSLPEKDLSHKYYPQCCIKNIKSRAPEFVVVKLLSGYQPLHLTLLIIPSFSLFEIGWSGLDDLSQN